MGHCIQAIIGKHKSVEKIADNWNCAQEIELPQGYGMVFKTNFCRNIQFIPNLLILKRIILAELEHRPACYMKMGAFSWNHIVEKGR